MRLESEQLAALGVAHQNLNFIPRAPVLNSMSVLAMSRRAYESIREHTRAHMLISGRLSRAFVIEVEMEMKHDFITVEIEDLHQVARPPGHNHSRLRHGNDAIRMICTASEKS